MPYDVEAIEVSFGANRNATVEEARQLEVEITKKFIDVINSHEKIRPFLREYPFPASRTDVMINFYKVKKNKSVDDNVELVFHVRDKLFYKTEDPDNEYLYRTIKEEPYEEALKIVHGET